MAEPSNSSPSSFDPALLRPGIDPANCYTEDIDLVASLRATRSAAKTDKDIAQSAVLAAVLIDKFEGDLVEATRNVPAGARKRLAQGARRAAALLNDRFPAARDFLEGLRTA